MVDKTARSAVFYDRIKMWLLRQPNELLNNYVVQYELSSATSMVVTLHWRAHALSVNLTSDGNSATGCPQRFALRRVKYWATPNVKYSPAANVKDGVAAEAAGKWLLKQPNDMLTAST